MVRHRLATFVDDVLEVSIVGSFSRIGPAVRARIFRWTAPSTGAMTGRTVAITGPTSGLGLATTWALAALGARVVLIGRSERRLSALATALGVAFGEGRFPTVVADMGDLESVRDAVERIVASERRLDVLVDNAGAIYPERRENPDGFEATFALMVVGPFALETGLEPLLRGTPGSRVIAVTSGGMYTQRLPLDDPAYRQGDYSGPRAYARAKRAQVALMREWARRTGGAIAFTAMHPGWSDTPGLAESLPGFYRVMRPLLRTPEQGMDTIVWLATHPEPAAINGRLFLDRRPRPFDRVPSTRLSRVERRRLWELVAGMASGSDPG
jgi:NAD(P)-dependent dehydrogenase (short-subunit alcohol dehydrogenase family)